MSSIGVLVRLGFVLRVVPDRLVVAGVGFRLALVLHLGVLVDDGKAIAVVECRGSGLGDDGGAGVAGRAGVAGGDAGGAVGLVHGVGDVHNGHVVSVDVVRLQLGLLLRLGVVLRVVADGLVVAGVRFRLALVLHFGVLVEDGDAILVEGRCGGLVDDGRGVVSGRRMRLPW